MYVILTPYGVLVWPSLMQDQIGPLSQLDGLERRRVSSASHDAGKLVIVIEDE